MTPIHHAQYSHLPLSEDGLGRQAYDLHPFLPTYDETSSFPCAAFLNPCQGGSHDSDHQRGRHLQQEANQVFLSGGSTVHGNLPATPPAAKDGKSDNKNDSTVGDHSDPSSSGPGKWMPSKMRFIRKMMNNSDRITASKPRKSALHLQDQHPSLGDVSYGNNSNSLLSSSPIRVCSDCNTTKTPLWRSGPGGPKSLCNACGIRQRKARRAMAAGALNGGLIPTVAPIKVIKEKSSQGGEYTVPFKKRCKFTAADPAGKKLHVDEFTISLSKSSAFHRVFPQDETDAAMLLMALSCGLIRG